MMQAFKFIDRVAPGEAHVDAETTQEAIEQYVERCAGGFYANHQWWQVVCVCKDTLEVVRFACARDESGSVRRRSSHYRPGE